MLFLPSWLSLPSLQRLPGVRGLVSQDDGQLH